MSVTNWSDRGVVETGTIEIVIGDSISGSSPGAPDSEVADVERVCRVVYFSDNAYIRVKVIYIYIGFLFCFVVINLRAHSPILFLALTLYFTLTPS